MDGLTFGVKQGYQVWYWISFNWIKGDCWGVGGGMHSAEYHSGFYYQSDDYSND